MNDKGIAKIMGSFTANRNRVSNGQNAAGYPFLK